MLVLEPLEEVRLIKSKRNLLKYKLILSRKHQISKRKLRRMRHPSKEEDNHLKYRLVKMSPSGLPPPDR